MDYKDNFNKSVAADQPGPGYKVPEISKDRDANQGNIVESVTTQDKDHGSGKLEDNKQKCCSQR